MVVRQFLRRVWSRHSKLGKGRKKKQVWRRPTGRHNKMRWERRGYPAVVKIGYRNEKSQRDKINEKTIIKINNLSDLEKVGKNDLILLGRMGKKKKLEVMNEISKRKLNIHKLNPEKFVKNNTKKNESK